MTRTPRFLISFRALLTAVVVGLLAASFAVTALLTFFNNRANSLEHLTARFETASHLINERINRFLAPAYQQSRITLGLVGSGRFSWSDFGGIAGYWLEILRAYPNLEYLSAGFEETGEYFHVTRSTKGEQLAIRELRRNPETGKLGFRDYHPEDFPERPFAEDPDHEAGDPRGRPWYQSAKAAGTPVWTDAYIFLGEEGVPDIPGFTYATPFHDSGGKFQGVMSVDFSLTSLCQFLKTIQIPGSGFFFIVEIRDEAPDRVIAHPDREAILRPIPGQGSHFELVPESEVEEPIMRGFLDALPDQIGLISTTLRGPVRFKTGGRNFLGGYMRLEDPTGPRWVICGVVDEEFIMGHIHRNNLILAATGLASFLIAVLVALIQSARISRPLRVLAEEAGIVGQGRFDPIPDRRSAILEIDRLYTAAEEMKSGLRSFQKYIPRELVLDLISSGEDALLGGERKRLAVFFSDVEGFTSLSEGMPPEEVVRFLTEVHQTLSEEVVGEGGTIDKFIGDALMAFWGAPREVKNPSVHACRAALACRERFRRLKDRWRSEGRPSPGCRIGIHTGEVVVGNMGTINRMDYTVIGDGVNLASRLEGLNKHYGTVILLSEDTYRDVSDEFLARPIDRVSVKGRSRSTIVYELLAARGESSDPDLARIADLHAEALGAYFRGEWEEAIRGFGEVLGISPEDPPARVLLERCREYLRDSPPDNWDGIHHMEMK
ncbi:MAG: hypothetical protein GHCLOJNM_04053 [bacterium]|nr:hypothetical protein [bacterium]